jgi:hypothetical protein
VTTFLTQGAITTAACCEASTPPASMTCGPFSWLSSAANTRCWVRVIAAYATVSLAPGAVRTRGPRRPRIGTRTQPTVTVKL